MPGLAEIFLGAAPIAGGALLGVAAGSFKGPDVRGQIKQDFDLLERIPPEETERRANVQASINRRIDDLVKAGDRGRALREAALSYGGNWRDIFLFLNTVMFVFIWWHVSHSRTNWLTIFILMIVLSIIAGVYALRGVSAGVAPPPTRTPPQSARVNGPTRNRIAPAARSSAAPRPRRHTAGCPEPRNRGRRDKSRSCARHSRR